VGVGPWCWPRRPSALWECLKGVCWLWPREGDGVGRGEEGRPVEKVKAHGRVANSSNKNECNQYQDMKTDVVSRRLSHWWYLTVSTEPQGKQETPSKGGPSGGSSTLRCVSAACKLSVQLFVHSRRPARRCRIPFGLVGGPGGETLAAASCSRGRPAPALFELNARTAQGCR
jgi:hypothetical protein